MSVTMDDIRADFLRRNTDRVMLHTFSRLSFPEDARDDEWGWYGTTASTLREVADPIWRDYCVRHHLELPRYTVELLDGTMLDLDAPVGEIGELRSNGRRDVLVRFKPVKGVLR